MKAHLSGAAWVLWPKGDKGESLSRTRAVCFQSQEAATIGILLVSAVDWYCASVVLAVQTRPPKTRRPDAALLDFTED